MSKYRSEKQNSSFGLPLYRHANKSRRKVPSSIILILLSMMLSSSQFMSICVNADDKVVRVDPLALLSQTLRTYTRTGCEHEPITLSCPRGTSISIDVAQYMPTTIENECVAVTENIIQDGVVNAGTEIEIKAPEKCSSWQNELSVSSIKSITMEKEIFTVYVSIITSIILVLL